MKNIFWKKCLTLYLLYIGIGNIGIVIGRYEKFHIGILSVSVDKKIEFIDYPANSLILKCLIPIFRNMYNCKLSNNKECLKQKNRYVLVINDQ